MSTSLQRFRTPITAIVVGLAVLAACFLAMVSADNKVISASSKRYESFLLADELRQSSDDLTRLARTYVATGDARWEQQYFEILDIRNGKKPRPSHYERIYWDFRAANMAVPPAAGESVPLQELMKRAGFTEAEFAKLKQAQQNSDDLVNTETVAMNMVKGLFKDEKGQFTQKGEPDTAKALAMMHDLTYHQYKGKIMTPVNEFLTLLDERTSAEVAAAIAERKLWVLIVTAAGLVTLACTLWALRQWWWINGRLGADPDTVVGVVQQLATGDLNAAKAHAQAPTGSVLAGLHGMGEQLAQVIATVRVSAENVASASGEIAQGNQDLSNRTEQQASALQMTASTMDQLGTTVRNNADNARQANSLALGASQVAAQGGEVVNQVVETMKGINDSSRRINDIISVIDGIAFQTNILALNAAVEAARAGEQGRGFAVVAGEVRSLAQRSADAAKEIKQLITSSVERVDQGTVLVDKAGQTMQEIVSAIERVNQVVAEISTASQEQSAGVQQVGQSITQMDQATQQNAALVEQAAASADSLKGQAQELVRAVASFKVQ